MLTRRFVCAGLGATLLAPSALAATAERRFRLFRGRDEIGRQTIRIARSGDETRVNIDVDIQVRLLGMMSVYSYQLNTAEVWKAGALQSLTSQGNDNGKAEFVRARGTSGGVQVDGSGYSGFVPGQPGTTTYWTQAFLRRPVWINTQNGLPMNVAVQRLGNVSVTGPAGTVNATAWRCGGDMGRLDLYFDASGEWVGSEFDARGETARFVLDRRGAALAPLWSGA